LKQAPRAWYDRLSNFLIKNDFKRGQVDTTLFRRTLEKYILVVQIYVDDIIFGSTNASLCKKFSKLMQDEFEMSMMGELKFFLGFCDVDFAGDKIERKTTNGNCQFLGENLIS